MLKPNSDQLQVTAVKGMVAESRVTLMAHDSVVKGGLVRRRPFNGFCFHESQVVQHGYEIP